MNDVVLYTFKASDSAIEQSKGGNNISSSDSINTVLQLLHKQLKNDVNQLDSDDAATLQKLVDDSTMKENE